SSRLIIAILVTMAVLVAYQQFLQWRYPTLHGPKAKPSPVGSPTANSSVPPIASASPSGLEGAAPSPENPAVPSPVGNQARTGNGTASSGAAAFAVAPGR